MDKYIFQNFKIEILYEDDYLAILNKPFGLLTHKKNVNDKEPSLCESLSYRFDIKDDEPLKEGIVHRLDKNTSGIIIIAKNKNVKKELSELFKNREINKYYITYVLGNFINKDLEVLGKIARQSNKRTKFKMSLKEGKDSQTIINHLQTYFGSISILECKIITGRTHQIRVHLSELGYPLIGDNEYQKNRSQKFALKNLPEHIKKFVLEFPRHALHSYKLDFIHPILNKKIYIECDLPKDLVSLDKVLKNER